MMALPIIQKTYPPHWKESTNCPVLSEASYKQLAVRVPAAISPVLDLTLPSIHLSTQPCARPCARLGAEQVPGKARAGASKRKEVPRARSKAKANKAQPRLTLPLRQLEPKPGLRAPSLRPVSSHTAAPAATPRICARNSGTSWWLISRACLGALRMFPIVPPSFCFCPVLHDLSSCGL